MSFKDTLKGKLDQAKGKAGDLAQQHGDKIESGLDKAARTVTSKTPEKYTAKVDSGVNKAVNKAKGALDHLRHLEGHDTPAGGTPT